MKKTLFIVIVTTCWAGIVQPKLAFSQEYGEMLERLFSRMDRNQDGVLEQDETPGEFWSKMIKADANQDGKIGKSEAAAGMKGMAVRFGMDGRQSKPAKEDSAETREKGVSGSKGAPDRLQQMLEKFGKDGKIALDDVPAPVRDRLSKLDKNQDKVIDRTEFAAARRDGLLREMGEGNGPMVGVMIDRMQQMYQQLDKDGDGKVALLDFPEMFRERLGALDSNKDGVLDQSEFKSIANMGKRADGSPRAGKPEGGRYGLGSDSTAPQAPKRPAETNQE